MLRLQMPRQKRNRGEGKSASELSKEIMPLNGATKDELLGALRGDKRSHELVKEVVEQLISQRPFNVYLYIPIWSSGLKSRGDRYTGTLH